MCNRSSTASAGSDHVRWTVRPLAQADRGQWSAHPPNSPNLATLLQQTLHAQLAAASTGAQHDVYFPFGHDDCPLCLLPRVTTTASQPVKEQAVCCERGAAQLQFGLDLAMGCSTQRADECQLRCSGVPQHGLVRPVTAVDLCGQMQAMVTRSSRCWFHRAMIAVIMPLSSWGSRQFPDMTCSVRSQAVQTHRAL